MKKSQITIFILLTVVVFLFFTLLISFRNTISSVSTSSISDDFLTFERFITGCVDEVVRENIFYYGLSNLNYELLHIFDFCFQESGSDTIDVINGTYTFFKNQNSVVFTGNQSLAGLSRDAASFYVEVPISSELLLRTENGVVQEDFKIYSSDYRVELFIPQGTIVTDIDGNFLNNPTIQIKLKDQITFESKIGQVDYFFFPEGLQFSNPVLITKHLELSYLNDLNISFDTFELEHFSPLGYSLIPITYDFTTESFTVEVSHFSSFGSRIQKLARVLNRQASSSSSSSNSNPSSCQNWDNDANAPCPSGWSNCDCSGHCGTQGLCSDSSSTPLNSQSCQNIDANTGNFCPSGWSNCDCAGDCGTLGPCSASSGVYNPGHTLSNQPAPSTSGFGTRGLTGGFVWKPISENDRRLVVLLPSSYRRQVQSVGVYSASGSLLESGRFSGDVHNGNRPHYRFSKPGAGYGTNIYVVATLNSGAKVHWHIPNGARRVG